VNPGSFPIPLREAVGEARERIRTLTSILALLCDVSEDDWTQSHRDTALRAEHEQTLIVQCVRQTLSAWELDEISSARAARLIRETMRLSQALCSARAQKSTAATQLFRVSGR
jgi:hypothetical protein